jgi:hypothetical protein
MIPNTQTVRLEYFVDDLPIADTRHDFDFQQIKSIADHYLAKLKPFSEKIHQQGGYVKLNISNPKDIPNGFHFEITVLGLNEKLNSEINDAGVFKL